MPPSEGSPDEQEVHYLAHSLSIDPTLTSPFDTGLSRPAARPACVIINISIYVYALCIIFTIMVSRGFIRRPVSAFDRARWTSFWVQNITSNLRIKCRASFLYRPDSAPRYWGLLFSHVNLHLVFVNHLKHLSSSHCSLNESSHRYLSSAQSLLAVILVIYICVLGTACLGRSLPANQNQGLYSVHK